MRVLKFGGSSVTDPQSVTKVAEIIKSEAGEYGRITVVVSARAGLTNRLSEICEIVMSQNDDCESLIKEIESDHLIFARQLIAVSKQPGVLAEIMALCNQLNEIVKGASLVGEVTARTRDLILSYGEQLSAFILYSVLKQELSDIIYTDSRKLIITDSAFGHASVDFEATNRLINDFYRENSGIIIVTGFIAATSRGETTTLGRNGSDYTASILGAALEADAIEIWSDTDGVMTADPQFVEGVKNIPQLTYNEAMELSHFGAKILFPASLQPAMAKDIPIVVKNTFNPEHPGTLICKRKAGENGFFKGISSLSKITLINVEGSGMVGVTGVAARMFNVLSGEKISVILISQASSEHSICIAIMEDDAVKAKKLLQQCFAHELRTGLISSVECLSGQAVVAVVGENMRNMPGIAARVFTPLGRNGINIKAISQGSSELNISFVINRNDLAKTLRILHQSLFENKLRQIHLYIAGTGLVGGRLLELIREKNDYLVKKNIDLRLCGLINSRIMLQNMHGPDNKDWKEYFERSGKKADLKRFVNKIVDNSLENSIFVDVTPSDKPVDYYPLLLTSSVSIVSANKRANSGKLDNYREIHSGARKRNVSFNYETNVGAGLPVINTIRNILAGGDRIIKIECVISGTLNWLLSEYDGTLPFGSLVKKAKEMGLTEPDPSEDLSGRDVARKCLILARECGFEMEPEEIASESLFPPELSDSLKGEKLFETLVRNEPWYRKIYSKAASAGKVLKYIAVVEAGNVRTGLCEINDSHPFFRLKGSENCIVFTTSFYNEYPMVIRGPGAGADVTAAGILADIVRIAEQIRQ